jgi:hypothetical protein
MDRGKVLLVVIVMPDENICRTLDGAQIFARLRSVVSTARKQGRNILQTLAASPSHIMRALNA